MSSRIISASRVGVGRAGKLEIMDRNAEAEDAAQAFERLRCEVALLRRALEGLAAEQQAAPDYSPTLGDMTEKLGAIVHWAKRLNEIPALRRTEADMAREVAAAAEKVRAEGQALIRTAEEGFTTAVRAIDAIVARHREASVQRRLLVRAALAGALAGILFWTILAGLVIRSGVLRPPCTAHVSQDERRTVPARGRLMSEQSLSARRARQ